MFNAGDFSKSPVSFGVFMPSIVIIANPENRRCTFFQEALIGMGKPPATVIPYLDILQNRVSLSDFNNPKTIIRIESPGENFEVEKEILKRGGVNEADSIQYERGRIVHPGKWFIGFSTLMNQILQDAPNARWFNHPEDIITMFDKPRCKKLLPHAIPPLPSFSSYDDFFEFVQTQPRKRYFIKLNYSSSASGIIAYEFNARQNRERGISTIEFIHENGENKFFNSLIIRKYSQKNELKTIIDFLFSEGAFVEPWIAKATHENQTYDLRVLGIKSKRHHSIGRLSRSPMTNLHLGNKRCSTDQLNISQKQWHEIDQIVEYTMTHFHRSLYAGLDIILPDGEDRSPILLEVNAFGDLIPQLLFEGKNSYEAEIMALLQK